MTTARLNLDIPGIGTAPYATKINDALQRIDDASLFFVGLPAAGSASGKDKSAVSAAITAAKANVGGGVVRFGAGTYDVGDLEITLPEWGATNKSVYLKGESQFGTILKFSVDRGPGAYAIRGDGVTDGKNYFNVIEDMSIVGPGTLGAINTSPADMDCIRWDTQMKLNRVAISLFRSALVSVGNHCEARSVETPNNYYGVYFTVTYGQGGDILLDNCKLSGVRRASIAVGNTVATFRMTKGHLGFAPYAVLFEPNPGGTLSMGGTQFDGVSFEFVGNSHFYSTDQSARVDGVQFLQCGNFSRNFDDYGIAAQTFNPCIYVSEWVGVEFIGGMPRIDLDTDHRPVSDTGAVIDVTGKLRFWTDRWKTAFDTAVSAGVPFILGPALASSTQTEVDLRERVFKGFAANCFAADDIDAGMVLEWDAFNRVRAAGHYGLGNRTPIAGVALNGVSAGGRELVVVVRNGRNIPVLSDGAAASSFTLVVSSATAGKASGIVYDGTSTRPLIGPSYGGVAVPTTAATVATDVDIR